MGILRATSRALTSHAQLHTAMSLEKPDIADGSRPREVERKKSKPRSRANQIAALIPQCAGKVDRNLARYSEGVMWSHLLKARRRLSSLPNPEIPAVVLIDPPLRIGGEVAGGRLAYDHYIMQSGVGNVPNAVMAGLLDSKFENIQAYTEVVQDGMLDLIDAGKMAVASATSFALSPEYAEKMNREAEKYRKYLVLRPLQISNSPEVIRRMGLISSNGMIEADIYGNINSTHVAGTRVMNGVCGSGDFTRNVFVSTFISPSVAKGDAMVVITEYGYADLRGLSPKQ